jgi:hypothetical protein
MIDRVMSAVSLLLGMVSALVAVFRSEFIPYIVVISITIIVLMVTAKHIILNGRADKSPPAEEILRDNVF